jgi:hypothetical protein
MCGDYRTEPAVKIGAASGPSTFCERVPNRAAAYAKQFDIGSTAAVPLSSTNLSRDIMVEDEATQAELQPLATAKFSYTILPKR